MIAFLLVEDGGWVLASDGGLVYIEGADVFVRRTSLITTKG